LTDKIGDRRERWWPGKNCAKRGSEGRTPKKYPPGSKKTRGPNGPSTPPRKEKTKIRPSSRKKPNQQKTRQTGEKKKRNRGKKSNGSSPQKGGATERPWGRDCAYERSVLIRDKTKQN